MACCFRPKRRMKSSTMHVAQPTISSGIAELESELGVKLFHRSGRAVEPTIEGRNLVNYAIQNDHPRLETLSLYRDRLILVVGSSHSFSRKRMVTLSQVVREPLILFHSDSVSRRLVDEKFAEAGVSPRVVMAMRSPEAMRKLVEAGVGISFLPYITVKEALDSGEVKEVNVKGVSFSREIGLAWKRGRYFGPAIQSLPTAVVDEFGKGTAFRKLRG